MSFKLAPDYSALFLTRKQPNFITNLFPREMFSNRYLFLWNLRYYVLYPTMSLLNFWDDFCLSGYSVSSSYATKKKVPLCLTKHELISIVIEHIYYNYYKLIKNGRCMCGGAWRGRIEDGQPRRRSILTIPRETSRWWGWGMYNQGSMLDVYSDCHERSEGIWCLGSKRVWWMLSRVRLWWKWNNQQGWTNLVY